MVQNGSYADTVTQIAKAEVASPLYQPGEIEGRERDDYNAEHG